MPRKNSRPAARKVRERLKAQMDGKAKRKPRVYAPVADHGPTTLAAAMLAVGAGAVLNRRQ